MKETIHEYLNNKVPSFMINEKKNNYHFKIIKPCNTKGEFNKIEKLLSKEDNSTKELDW